MNENILIDCGPLDEPRPQTNNRRTYSRGMPRFPFMSGGFPMMEGYTFITLDVGDRTNPVSDSLFSLYNQY